MMQQMASYASSNITTEVIQKYLDENKQLILAILDNQNLGRLNECAMYQAKLQQNLMYLAAIADAQPQGVHNNPPAQAAAAPAPAIQPAQQYLQQQQQLFMNQRNSIPQYLQQSQQASQQSFYTQQALMSGGSAGLHMLSSADQRGMQGADNGPQLSTGFSDGGSGGRDGNQSSQLGMRGDMHHTGGGGGGAAGGPDLGVSSPMGHRDGGSGQGGDDSEASYLKGSDASSL